jgi:RNA polymerase sigma-70 factor (ECF subfamily)
MHLNKEVKMNEETLIPKILSGDNDSFAQLYEQYSAKAYRTALLITGNIHTAEDTLQETFVQCCKTMHKLKSPSAFPAYFYRILTRTAWKLSAKDRNNLPLEDTILTDKSVTNESYLELYSAIASLDTKLRTVVILFYFNDLTVRDIAKITGTLEGTVKSRLYTARKRLSKILKKEDYYG